jgi:hypothetical protein
MLAIVLPTVPKSVFPSNSPAISAHAPPALVEQQDETDSSADPGASAQWLPLTEPLGQAPGTAPQPIEDRHG